MALLPLAGDPAPQITDQGLVDGRPFELVA